MGNFRTIGMLVALSAATFAVTSSGSATAPFLQVISQDLSSTLAAVAHLFSAQAITWGTTALITGTLSDRLGHRSTLIGSIVLLGATRLGFATAHSYSEAIWWQVISGVGGGAFMGTVFATVAEHVPAGSRGRALSWIITGQSLSLVVGVPLVTLLGAVGGWRGALATHGALTIAMALAVYFATPPDVPHHADARRTKLPVAELLRPKLIALMAAGTTERVCFAILAVYLPTYLQRAYGISFGLLASALALVAAGTLIGNLFGGRIADRSHSRSAIFAIALALTATLALPTFLWQPGLAISVALGFAYSFVNAAGRPALMATLADMPSELRGALFGLNITMASMGWLLAGSLGGWLIAVGGFNGVGVFCSAMALLGAGLALASGMPHKTKS